MNSRRLNGTQFNESAFELLANLIHGGTHAPLTEDHVGTSSFAAPEDDPNDWFRQHFPKAYREHGDALRISARSDGRLRIAELNETFFAAALGEGHASFQPYLYLSSEDRFLQYVADRDSPDFGIYRTINDRKAESEVVQVLEKFVRDYTGQADVEPLKFKLAKHRNLHGIVQRAKALLSVDHQTFLDSTVTGIACRNGFLQFDTGTLIPFSTELRLRHKISVPCENDAQCPRFLSFLAEALDNDDIDLLRRWSGLVLSGINRSQSIMVLHGASGSGKSSFLRILGQIIGQKRVAQLRTKHLDGRFEQALLGDVTLLAGTDVKSNFFQHDGAALLKSLTGGDQMLMEQKNSNLAQRRAGNFNVGLTCNALPVLNLEGDTDAWQRRLRIITFRPAGHRRSIADFFSELLDAEGSGILNWCLEGLRQLRGRGWNLEQTPRQKLRVERLLGSSDTVRSFLEQRIERCEGGSLRVHDAYTAYLEFCTERELAAESERRFGSKFKELVADHHGFHQRNDFQSATGTQTRGWAGLQLVIPPQ